MLRLSSRSCVFSAASPQVHLDAEPARRRLRWSDATRPEARPVSYAVSSAPSTQTRSGLCWPMITPPCVAISSGCWTLRTGSRWSPRRSICETAARRVRGHLPDVLILDLHLPNGSAVGLVRELRGSVPETQVVVLTMENSPAFVKRALDAGAVGYVLKEHADRDLVPAVLPPYEARVTSRPRSRRDSRRGAPRSRTRRPHGAGLLRARTPADRHLRLPADSSQSGFVLARACRPARSRSRANRRAGTPARPYPRAQNRCFALPYRSRDHRR